MIGISVSFAALAFMAAHAAILVQFIGTSNTTLFWLSLTQAFFLVSATGFIVVAVITVQGQSTSTQRRLWHSSIGLTKNLKQWWQDLPGWLIFLCVLLIATVGLGEISILIARLQGNELSWLQHVPTITVLGVCAVLCLAWLVRLRQPG